jgi:ribosomal protein S27E
MNKTLCPGQDMRFWRPGDIFDVTCGECGTAVEFFKDEASHRCPKCGNKITNPRLSLGCAQWCEHAKECLGYDPHEQTHESEDELPLVDRLVASLKSSAGIDQDYLDRAFAVLGHAKELIKKTEADPRLVMAAALLHGVADRELAKQIMEKADMDRSSILGVADAIRRLGSGKDIDTPELRILRDSVLLSKQDGGKTQAGG